LSFSLKIGLTFSGVVELASVFVGYMMQVLNRVNQSLLEFPSSASSVASNANLSGAVLTLI
jgi:hypothetical protein